MPAIPRRLSVHDIDYDTALGARLRVFFDGVDQLGRVEAYDLDAGTVTRLKLNSSGQMYVVGDEIARETVHGQLTVELLPS